MRVLAVVDDLLFRSKIDAVAQHAGASLDVAASPETARVWLGELSWDVLLIDCELPCALEFITAVRAQCPGLPIIGYGSHVDYALAARAVEAGCSRMLPRSAFVRELPTLLA